MQAYFYIIRHKPSGKYYAGSRRNKHGYPGELLKEDGYKTSSNLVKEMIQRDGLDSFEVALIIPQSHLQIGVLDYETAFLRANDCKRNPLWINRSNNEGTYGFAEFTEEHKANMKGRCGKWERQEKDREHVRRLMTKTNLEKNAMNNPESRAKVAASKVGRKRIYREDGTFYLSPRMG